MNDETEASGVAESRRSSVARRYPMRRGLAPRVAGCAVAGPAVVRPDVRPDVAARVVSGQAVARWAVARRAVARPAVARWALDAPRGSTLVLVLALTSLVVACGFRPRGDVVSLSDPGSLFIDSDRDLSIEGELRASLRDRAFRVADNRDEADIVLRVAAERQSQRIVSVRSTGRVSEYELAHEVMLSISRPDVDTASAPVSAPRADRVQVKREYTYVESQVLGKENEASILRAELREELVRQIVLRTVASLARSTSAERVPAEPMPAEPSPEGALEGSDPVPDASGEDGALPAQ